MKGTIKSGIKLCAGMLFAGLLFNSANVYAADVKIDKTNFPDSSFRYIVKEYDTNGNGKLSDSEIKKVKSLSGQINGYDDEYILTIKSLKGLERFYNLESFYICTSGIEKIDFSKNKKLKDIAMEDATGLKSVNVNGCKN